MKKKKKRSGDPEEGIIWPATPNKDESLPKSHHEQPGPPGSDHLHNDDDRNKDRRRVWEEKNKRNLPPKK